jgi:hypothetical protein
MAALSSRKQSDDSLTSEEILTVTLPKTHSYAIHRKLASTKSKEAIHNGPLHLTHGCTAVEQLMFVFVEDNVNH